ncbi:MAG: zinc-ribbon domain-containing protein [Desulfobacteraceae bacterium]
MIITCEKCGTKFNLDESLLKQEGSKVRCSQCRHIFISYPPLAQKPRETGPDSDLNPSDKETLRIDDLSNFDLDEKDLNFEFEFETSEEAEPDAKNIEFDSDETEESLDFEIEDESDTLDIELEDESGNLDFKFEDETDSLEIETQDEPDALDFEIDDELQIMKDELSDFETDYTDTDDASAEFQGLREQAPDKEYKDRQSLDIDKNESSFQEPGQGEGIEENLDELSKEKEEVEPESELLSLEGETQLKEKQVAEDAEKEVKKQEDVKEDNDDDDDHDKEKDDLIPYPDLSEKDRGEKPAKLRKIIMAALVLVLFLFAGYSLCIMRGIEIPYITSLEIPYLTEHLKPAEKIPDIKLVPDKKSVKGKFITNTSEGTLFIITGRVTSNSKTPAAHAKVTGTLITKGKIKAMEKTVFCGNTLDEDALKTYEFSKIEQVMSRKKGESNMNTNITIDRPVPFMVVFKDLPDNLENFTITVTDFDQGNLNNKK